MILAVEIFLFENLEDFFDGGVLDQHRAERGLLRLNRMRRDVGSQRAAAIAAAAEGIAAEAAIAAGPAGFVIAAFWHGKGSRA